MENRIRDHLLYLNFSETLKNYQLLNGLNKLIYLFSGGKDATIGLDFLQRYIDDNELDITLQAIMVTYPLHVYFLENGRPNQDYQDTLSYWHDRGIELQIFKPNDNDLTADDEFACKTCKAIRKSYVDPYINSEKENGDCKLGVVTGYTLYDALAYMDEILLSTNFMYGKNQFLQQGKIQNRVNNCLHKMKPREELPNGLSIIRPLINMREDQIMDYIEKFHIPFIKQPCKAAKDKHKREYFKTLNVAAPINNSSYEGLSTFLNTLGINEIDGFDDIQMENYFTDC